MSSLGDNPMPLNSFIYDSQISKFYIKEKEISIFYFCFCAISLLDIIKVFALCIQYSHLFEDESTILMLYILLKQIAST